MLSFENVKHMITGRTELSCGTFLRIVNNGKVSWHGLTGGLVSNKPAPTWISRKQLETHCTPESHVQVQA